MEQPYYFSKRVFLRRIFLFIVVIIGTLTLTITVRLSDTHWTSAFSHYNDSDERWFRHKFLPRSNSMGDRFSSNRTRTRNAIKVSDTTDFREKGIGHCSMYSNAYQNLIHSDIPSNFSDWTYKNKRNCPNFVIPAKTNTRRVQYYLKCLNTKANLVPHITFRTNDIQILRLNNPCLAAFINNCCVDERGVPNILHYVWYFKKEMEFTMFLSLLSALRYIKPCLILFHGDFLPYGKYWDFIVSIYPSIMHIKRPRPLYIFGMRIKHHEHSGDIMRLEALMELGGIYFDHDFIALRDLEPLRDYHVTLCNQSNGYLLNSFIMAKKNATFLRLWMNGYRKDFRRTSYGYNSMKYNNQLAKERPDLVHIEQGTLCSPTELIYRNIKSPLTYDWSNLYGYHLHSKTFRFKWDEIMIKTFNTTIGAMARQVLYGNKELCDVKVTFPHKSGSGRGRNKK